MTAAVAELGHFYTPQLSDTCLVNVFVFTVSHRLPRSSEIVLIIVVVAVLDSIETVNSKQIRDALFIHVPRTSCKATATAGYCFLESVEAICCCWSFVDSD